MWLLREKGTAEGPIAHLAGSAQRSPRFSSFSTYLMFYDFFDPLKADFVNFTPLDAASLPLPAFIIFRFLMYEV